MEQLLNVENDWDGSRKAGGPIELVGEIISAADEERY